MAQEIGSIFLQVEGNRPLNRIWDFLIVHAEYDYSLKEISIQAGVSYAMTKLLFKNYFIPRKLVEGRIVGRAKLFQLDFKNPAVIAFRNYYLTVIEAHTAVDEQSILVLSKKKRPL